MIFKIGDLVVRDFDKYDTPNPWDGDYTQDDHPRIFVIHEFDSSFQAAFPEDGNGTFLIHLRLATPLEKAML